MAAFSSNSWVQFSWCGALKEADATFGPARKWSGITQDQSIFLGDYERTVAELAQLNDHESKSKLSHDSDVMTRWLRAHSLSVPVWTISSGHCAAAVIVRKSAHWKVAGCADLIQFGKDAVRPAVRMSGNAFTTLWSQHHSFPIVRIPHIDGSEWHLTKAADSFEGPRLFQRLSLLNDSIAKGPRQANALIFPMMDFERCDEEETLVGMFTVDQQGRRWELRQCMQHLRITMNELGEPPAMPTTAPVTTETIVIDGPLHLWITRPGIRLPLLVAQLSYDTFKRPQTTNLGDLIVDDVETAVL